MPPQVARSFFTLVGLVLVIGLHNYNPLPWGTQLWASYRDALHVPMFVLVTCLFWWLLNAQPLKRRVVLCFLGCTLFAVVSEAIQLLREVGTASLADLGVDLLTSILVLLTLWLLAQPRNPRRLRNSVVALLAMTLAGMAIYPVWVTREAYAHRVSVYPRLTDYSVSSAMLFHSCRARCELRHRESSVGEQEVGLHVTFAGYDWPGVNLLEVLPPTPAHKWLVVDFELHGSEPMELFVILNPSQLRSLARTVQRNIFPQQTRISFSLEKLTSGQPQGETLRIGLFTSPQFLGRQLSIRSIGYGL